MGSLRARLASVGEPVWLSVALALFVAQELAITYIDPDGSWAWLRRAAFFVVTPLFVLVALHFRRFLGAWIIAIGITMNFLPMAAHGGNMPVAYETVVESGAFPDITEDTIGGQIGNSKDVVLWREDIRLEPLSDRIIYTIPGYRLNIYSPGDVVIGAGILVTLVEAVAFLFGFSWSRVAARLPIRHRPGASAR
jgi:hypothetical protein